MKRQTWLSMIAVLAILIVAGGCHKKQKAPVPPLMDPHGAEMTRQAPEVFRAQFKTNRGDFVVEVTRAWSPHGADRLYNLVSHGYYDGCRFFRVIQGFIAQFGINGTPDINQIWRYTPIADDPVKGSNRRGVVTFAKSSYPNSRSTQIFINLADNTPLDGVGFAPVGRVIEGMAVVDSLYAGYGEGAPRGQGPDQGRLEDEGNAYLESNFARLDYVEKAVLLQP